MSVTSSVSSTVSSIISKRVYIPPLSYLQPKIINNKWQSAKISGRLSAKYKKLAILAGVQWPYPEKENIRNHKLIKFKGHKHEKQLIEKKKKIELSMADMPKKLEEYYKNKQNIKKKKTVSPLSILLGKKLYQKYEQQKLDQQAVVLKQQQKEKKQQQKQAQQAMSEAIKAGKSIPTIDDINTNETKTNETKTNTNNTKIDTTIKETPKKS